MDPIDFNPPEQSQQDEAELLRLRRALRSLLTWVVLVPLAWFLLATLMAAVQQAQEGVTAISWPALTKAMHEPTFQAPLRELAWKTADMLFWPVIVVVGVVLLRGAFGEVLIRRRLGAEDETASHLAMQLPSPHHGEQSGGAQGLWRIATLAMDALKLVPMAVAGFAAIWAVMAAYAFIDGRDHWEALPWVTPPYLSEFLNRHPELTVQRGADTSGRVTLRDRQGRSMRLHGTELVGAQVRVGPCPAAPGAAQLGGIPPYANMPCTALVHLRDAQGQASYYVFELANGSDTAAIKTHFSAWSDVHSSGSGSSSSKGRYSLSATSRDDAWHLQVDASQGGATTVVIRHRTETTR